MDSILGYHMNPLTCGVAKFNMLLSRHLGIPSLNLFDHAGRGFQDPLLSFKISEFSPKDVSRLGEMIGSVGWWGSFRLFLHDWTDSDMERCLLRGARSVYCGNSEIALRIRPVRPDIQEVWCPGMLVDVQPFKRCALSVFSFGMAHKLHTDRYRRLKTLLDRTGKTYCLYLSTALHENTSFDGSFIKAFEELREIFGSRVYFLGFLSDAAVYNYLSETTFFAAFFEKGVRANNTSVHAAMQCGSVVITNLSDHSPRSFAHLDTVLDIHQCEELPTGEDELAGISARARELSAEEFGWSRLVERIFEREARNR